MFNMNPRVSDSPLDAPREFKAYCHQAAGRSLEQGDAPPPPNRAVKQKFRAVVNSSAQIGAEVLVCPDVGCGVFGNDPQVLGTLFGEVLREPLPEGALKEAEMTPVVLLTGQVAFAEAVKKAASGEKASPGAVAAPGDGTCHMDTLTVYHAFGWSGAILDVGSSSMMSCRFWWDSEPGPFWGPHAKVQPAEETKGEEWREKYEDEWRAGRTVRSDEEYLPCTYYPFSPEWQEKVRKTLLDLAHRGFA
ncbi:hypothetical protein AK812_SmicGene23716 [Symbiodinium microadriaticum]|uniref:Uncharacterized protein n=1 Tax=Symbiodinium microadriaticum TaxID=2951 RepID=A0A1Q9DGF6_SYMMI|nr:hypothetical protein AK812_SmicGene23716 [Symbiodinium microadriaticum]